MKLAHHGRSDYIQLLKRKTCQWDGNKRIASCINNNLENFAFMAGLRTDQSPPDRPPNTIANIGGATMKTVWASGYVDLLYEHQFHTPSTQRFWTPARRSPSACVNVTTSSSTTTAQILNATRNLRKEMKPTSSRMCTNVIIKMQANDRKPGSVHGWRKVASHGGSGNDRIFAHDRLPADDHSFWIGMRKGRIPSGLYAIELNIRRL